MSWFIRLFCLHLMYHVVQSDFCDESPDLAVSFDTVQVRFSAEKTGNESSPWNLTATVTWQPPDVEYDVLQYSVLFESSVTTDDLNLREDCQNTVFSRTRTLKADDSPRCPAQPRFNTIVNEPTLTVGDLLFGFPYRLLIHLGNNGTYSKKIFFTPYWIPPGEPRLFRSIADYRMDSPDCRAATGDLEYCDQQPQPPLCSPPRNVTVRVNHMSSMLYVTWEEPYYVDGNVSEYQVLVWKFDTGWWTDFVVVKVQGDDTLQHNFTLTTEDIAPEEYRISQGFIYEIRISPQVKAAWCSPLLEGGYSYELIDLREGASTAPSTFQPSPDPTEGPKPEESPTMTHIIIAAVVALVVTVSGCLIIYRFCRKKKRPKFEKRVSAHTLSPKLKAEPATEFREKEIVHLFDVVVGEAIGSGQFGEVYKARWQHNQGKRLRKLSEPRPDPTITVAVKITKDDQSPAKKEEFLDEIRLMIEIGDHDNILSVLGCRTIEEPYYLITEYMKYGSLKDFLLKSREPEVVIKHPIYDLTDFKKLQISHQVTKGMEYLSETKYFHGDLAARNVLIGVGFSVKISDFGLSNDIYGTGYIRLPPENKRPVKWYSPEANLDGKCSTEGDVWSFGVLLYEVYSDGAEPYYDMQPREVITRINAGYRMGKPDECPDEVYGLMLDCWRYEPENRPTFFGLKVSIEDMLRNTRPESYFEPEHDESYIESEDKVETPVYSNDR